MTLDGLVQTLDESLEVLDEEHVKRASKRTPPEPPSHRGWRMSSPAVDALRHAAPDAYLVLDDDDRITHVSARLHDDFGRWIGHVLWEHLPAARDVYGPDVRRGAHVG